MLFASALIFSSQFLITKQYQKYKGTALLSTVRLTLWAHFSVAIMFIIKSWISKGTLKIDFTWFTFAVTFGMALVAFICTYMGIKVLAIGSMGVYSMFMMLGSLILPTFIGLLYGEPICDRKIIGIILMFVALLLSLESIEKSKLSLKAVLYYVGSFLCNGMVGVFLTLHQKNPAWTAGVELQNNQYVIDSDMYMIWYGLSAVMLCVAILFIIKVSSNDDKDNKKVDSAKTLLKTDTALLNIFVISISVLYGIGSGLGDYFIALATVPGALGSSVTFPIINGGTIIFSNIIGLICLKEKINFKTILSIIVVVCATVLFMFATM